MPQVTEPEIDKSRLLYRFEPAGIAHTRQNGITPVGEAVTRMLALLRFQHGNRIMVYSFEKAAKRPRAEQ